MALYQYFNHLKRNMVRLHSMKEMAAAKEVAAEKAKGQSASKKAAQGSGKKPTPAQASSTGVKAKKKPVAKKG